MTLRRASREWDGNQTTVPERQNRVPREWEAIAALGGRLSLGSRRHGVLI